MSTNIFINQNLPSRQTSFSKNEAEDSIYIRVLMQMSDADRSLAQMISKDTIGKINQLIRENRDNIQYVKKIILAIASEVLDIDFFFNGNTPKSYDDVKDILNKSLQIAGNLELDTLEPSFSDATNTEEIKNIQSFISSLSTERVQIRNLIPKVYYRTSFQMMTDTDVEVTPIGCYRDKQNIEDEFQKLLTRTFDEIGGESSKAIVMKILRPIFRPNSPYAFELISDCFLKINDSKAIIEDHMAIMNSIYTYRPDGFKVYGLLSSAQQTNLSKIPYLEMYDQHGPMGITEEEILILQKFLIFIFKNLKYGTINYK